MLLLILKLENTAKCLQSVRLSKMDSTVCFENADIKQCEEITSVMRALKLNRTHYF